MSSSFQRVSTGSIIVLDVSRVVMQEMRVVVVDVHHASNGVVDGDGGDLLQRMTMVCGRRVMGDAVENLIEAMSGLEVVVASAVVHGDQLIVVVFGLLPMPLLLHLLQEHLLLHLPATSRLEQQLLRLGLWQ